MRRSSASCSTLTQLGTHKQAPLLSVCESSPSLWHSDDLEPTLLYLDNNNEALHLPLSKDDVFLDEYLSSIPRVASRSQELLSTSVDTLETDENVRYINILQGELAHASPSQADVLVSADATTCHVVALYSTTSSSSRGDKSNESAPLASLAHVDKVGYHDSLEEMVREHVQHHKRHRTATTTDETDENDDFGFFWDQDNEEDDEEELYQEETFVPLNDGSSSSRSDAKNDGNQPHQTATTTMIDMDIHMLGGFLDPNGKSQELSTCLILALVRLAKRFQHFVKMKLVTAAISCMNTTKANRRDDSSSLVSGASPRARGMGIDTRSGQVFLVNSIPPHLQGPALEVRSARLFSTNSSQDDKLHVIHHSKSQGELCISQKAVVVPTRLDLSRTFFVVPFVTRMPFEFSRSKMDDTSLVC